MNPTIEKYLSVALSAGLALIAVQPFAKGAQELLLFLAGGLGGYVIPNAKSRALAAQQRSNIATGAVMLLAVLVLAAQPACGSLPDAPAQDTLAALDEVCAVRAQHREVTDALATEADRQVREVVQQPGATEAPHDAPTGAPEPGPAPGPNAPEVGATP